jgi:hypothetical protein
MGGGWVLVAMLFGLIVPWSGRLPWSVRLVERVEAVEAGSWKVEGQMVEGVHIK